MLSNSRPTVVLEQQQTRPLEPPLPRARWPFTGRQGRLQTLLLALVVFTASYLAATYRSVEAIDFNADEATYAIESVSLYQTGMTRWNGGPFLVHPPVFFMIEALYFHLGGVGTGPLFQRLVGPRYQIGVALIAPDTPINGDDVFNAVRAGRYLAVAYGAAVATLVFLLATAFLNRKAGLAAAALAIVDPYLLRRNHFNMLEPLTTLFALLALYVFYRALNQQGKLAQRRDLLITGLCLGLAFMTKELAILYLPVLVIYAILFRRAPLRLLATPIGVSLAIYALFPLWAALNGAWDVWWSTKTWLLQRLTGVIADTGITRPGTSPGGGPLLYTFIDYWTSIGLLALAGGLAALFLYLYWRRGLRDRPAEFLTSAIVGSYGFFVLVAAVGGVINEQFFYLIMPIALLTDVYAVFAWRRLYAGLLTPGKADQRPLLRIASATPVKWVGQGLLGLLLIFAIYDVGYDIVRYVFSQDDSYVQVEGTLARTLPPGAGVVGRDILDVFVLPRNPVYIISLLSNESAPFVPLDIAQRRVPYALLDDQALANHNNGANEIFYDWVRENGIVVQRFKGWRWDKYAYQIDYSRPGAQPYGTSSLSARRPVVASSTENSVQYLPEFAVDLSITTRWSSQASDDQWIYIDLGESHQIHRVDIAWEKAYARSYELQVSDDARTWTTFYRTDQGRGQTEAIAASAQGRYVRLLMTKRATQYGYSIWEIAVYP